MGFQRLTQWGYLLADASLMRLDEPTNAYNALCVYIRIYYADHIIFWYKSKIPKDLSLVFHNILTKLYMQTDEIILVRYVIQFYSIDKIERLLLVIKLFSCLSMNRNKNRKKLQNRNFNINEYKIFLALMK